MGKGEVKVRLTRSKTISEVVQKKSTRSGGVTKKKAKTPPSKSKVKTPASSKKAKTPASSSKAGKATPKSTRRKSGRSQFHEIDSDDDNENEEVEVETPKKVPERSSTRVRTPAKTIQVPTPTTPAPTTPKSAKKRAINIKQSALQFHTLEDGIDDLDEDIENISCPHDETLPCRESQFEEIWNFVKENVDSKCSKAMFVSGVPGTGKTLVVRAVLDKLSKLPEYKSKFKMVYVNGLMLSSPDKIWKRFYKGLELNKEEKRSKDILKANASSHNFLKKLEYHFEEISGNRPPIVLVVDELDQLMDSKQQPILYRLLEWSSHASCMFTFLAIFNTMNLPENVLAMRNVSRMGFNRVVFAPYTHEELSKIIKISLLNDDTEKSKLLTKDGITLLSKKVANLSGDARRALEIARKTLEILEKKQNESGKTETVKIIQENAMKAVNEAFSEIFTSPKIEWLRNCSDLEKLFIKTLGNHLQSSGDDVTSIKVIQSQIFSTGFIDGAKYTTDHILHVVNKLFSMKLILLEDTEFQSIHRKVALSLSIEDINFAFKEKD